MGKYCEQCEKCGDETITYGWYPEKCPFCELAESQNILKQCLSIMPVGYVPTHTVENLPEMIGDLAKALAEETTEREKLERELSDMTQRRDELLASLEKVVALLSPPPSGD